MASVAPLGPSATERRTPAESALKRVAGVGFEPSPAGFMINDRVEDLDALLAILREEGCTLDEKVEASESGMSRWVMDPEGNRIEPWQPPEGR